MRHKGTKSVSKRKPPVSSEQLEEIKQVPPRYDSLLACYQSGQIPEDAWARLIDSSDHFAAWLRKHIKFETCASS